MLENVSFYVSVLVGGLVISFLGTLQSLYVQKEEFQAKGAFRDFFIGAILVTFLYQLVPDSINSFGSFLSDMKIPSFTMKGGANLMPLNPEFDLQVGVPRF
jgi:hypothetical protein